MTQGFSFKKANRMPTNLVISLAGPTGGGKTYTALRLAKGLARGGKIIAGDTEKGRLSRYADEFDFEVALINSPYRPQTYIDFLKAAYAQKPAVIILDSMTHEWVSQGGCLQWHDDLCREMAEKWGGSPEKYNFQAWGDPKKEHWLLISELEAPPCHIIMTFRAKDKFEQVKNDKGKTVINPRGMCPDGAEDLPFIADFVAMMDTGKSGVPSFSYKPLMHSLAGIMKPGEQLTEKHGELLAAWAMGRAAEAEKTEFKRKHMVDELIQDEQKKPDYLKWVLSDGSEREFPDIVSLYESVVTGINKSTSAESLEKGMQANDAFLQHLTSVGPGYKAVADEILQTAQSKFLTLKGIKPAV